MNLESILHLNEFCNQKGKNSKSDISKLLFTYFPLHLSKDETENKIKTEICKMDLANSLPHNHRC